MAEELRLRTDTRITKETFSNRSYNITETTIRGYVNELAALSQANTKEVVNAAI